MIDESQPLQQQPPTPSNSLPLVVAHKNHIAKRSKLIDPMKITKNNSQNKTNQRTRMQSRKTRLSNKLLSDVVSSCIFFPRDRTGADSGVWNGVECKNVECKHSEVLGVECKVQSVECKVLCGV